MSKSVPATPDYVGAAQQTAQSSADTTQSQTYANRPNVNTPWSQQTWSQTPTWDPTTGTYVNQWTQNTNLVPQAQDALNSQLGVAANQSATADQLTQQANQTLTAPLDWSSFQSMGTAPTTQTYGTPDAYANTAANAAYQEYTNRNQPLQQTALTNLDTQLQNQGLKPGDAAYDTAIKNLRNQQSDANTQADLGATQFGVQGGQTLQGEALAAGGQTYNEGLTTANYQDQVRQQQESEDLQKRGFTTNEINAMLTGQQVQTGPSPQFNAAGAAQPTNYSTAAQNAYSGDLNAANASNANTTNTLGTAAGVAAAFF
jgi:hypothetical protein